MDAAALLEFDDAAQDSYEACYPATISLPGFADVACAGGSVRQTGLDFGAGGAVGEYDLVFRVRKSLLGDAAPEVGTILTHGAQQWRIMRATNSPTSCAFVLYCGDIAKR